MQMPPQALLLPVPVRDDQRNSMQMPPQALLLPVPDDKRNTVCLVNYSKHGWCTWSMCYRSSPQHAIPIASGNTQRSAVAIAGCWSCHCSTVAVDITTGNTQRSANTQRPAVAIASGNTQRRAVAITKAPIKQGSKPSVRLTLVNIVAIFKKNIINILPQTTTHDLQTTNFDRKATHPTQKM